MVAADSQHAATAVRRPAGQQRLVRPVQLAGRRRGRRRGLVQRGRRRRRVRGAGAVRSGPDLRRCAGRRDGVFHRDSKRSDFIMPYLHGPGFVNDLPTDQAEVPLQLDQPDRGGSATMRRRSTWAPTWCSNPPTAGSTGSRSARPDAQRQGQAGALRRPVNLDLSGAETYDTVLSLTIAPSDTKVIWAGTDDGLVQVTRDGGAHWSNVTPRGAPKWARVYQVGVSAQPAGHGLRRLRRAHARTTAMPTSTAPTTTAAAGTRIDRGLPDAPVFGGARGPAPSGRAGGGHRHRRLDLARQRRPLEQARRAACPRCRWST